MCAIQLYNVQSNMLYYYFFEELIPCDHMTVTQKLTIEFCPYFSEDRQQEFLGSVLFLYFLALISVVLRIISRRVGGVRLWWDDYLIVLATVIRDSCRRCPRCSQMDCNF